MKKLYIKTYGCQMNVYDSTRMADVLAPLGYGVVDEEKGADLVILNTCHIREKAEDKLFSDLGRIRKEKDKLAKQGKNMLVAVGGCVAQAQGEEIIRRAPYVAMVFGPQSYHHLPEMVIKAVRGQSGIVELEFPAVPKFDFLPEAKASGATAYLSVQEGCDKFCTFCVVPYTRGSEYSRKVEAVEAEARNMIEKGAREITLLGQNVNAYHGNGPDGSEWNLAKLIRRLAKIDGLERIRYTTSHPRDMDDELIDVHGEVEKLMPYLHLPVQSGSDRILKAMNRRHTAEFYVNTLERLRKVRPDIALSSDFIVGFPGETEQDFKDTMALVETVGFASAFSFKYSPRPGTPAATDEKQIDEDVKVARLAQLQGLLWRQQEAFNRISIGKTMPVLFERKGKIEGQLIGKSPWQQSVHARDAEHCRGQIVVVQITGATQTSLTGELIAEKKIAA